MQVRRVVVYDGTPAPPRVIGEELRQEPPPAQPPPRQGTGPRVDTAKVVAHANRLPHTLLGWVGTNGLPVVARVGCDGVDERGLALSSSDAPLPPGGRRAGLTSHRFDEHMVGQEQRVHTGWLEVDDGHAVYAPHTKAGYAMPRSQAVMVVAQAVGMRSGYRKARELGLTH